MEVRDSRRLTGPNIVTDGPAAVIDVEVPDAAAGREAARRWRVHLERMLDAVGWGGATTVDRHFHGGMSLAFRAPIDALYAATEVNEWAWAAAAAELGADPAAPFEAEAERLRQLIAEEINPPLLALERAAAERGVAFLWDDDEVSVGLGRGSTTWPARAVPEPEAVDWSAVHDVPVAQITGTNGKTTTVRLLAAAVRAAGLVPGVSSTDWIAAGDELLDRGDYSGPGGARQVLRDRRVECAVLETARGGMLRRGLAVAATDVACVTNVAEDHLGEFGVHDLDALAECKFVVARAARRLVLNADDPVVRRHGATVSQPVTWFTLEPAAPHVAELRQSAAALCRLEWGRVVWEEGGEKVAIAEVADLPVTLGGAARHNVANVLAATAVARHLGIAVGAIADGLRSFESTPEDNPGRLNQFEIGGARVIVDFAHNPHGVRALIEMAARLPAQRRLLTIGQAGDRDDASIRELARATWSAQPDLVLVKELHDYLRGRAEGEIPALIEAELRACGAGDHQLARTGSELETVRRALEWAGEGDLVLLIVHSDRDEVVGYLEAAASS